MLPLWRGKGESHLNRMCCAVAGNFFRNSGTPSGSAEDLVWHPPANRRTCGAARRDGTWQLVEKCREAARCEAHGAQRPRHI
jgi:hypothetical protein